MNSRRILTSLLAVLVALFGAPAFGDGILDDTYTESQSFTDGLGSVTMKLTYDGVYYWSCSGNDTSGDRLARYAADGTLLDVYAPGIDFRSVFTASGASNPVYARGFADDHILVQTSPGSFAVHAALTGGVLDIQSSFVFNAGNDEFLAMSAGGVVDRYSAVTGNHLGVINLTGYGSLNNEDNYPQNRGLATAGAFILTYSEGVLSAWNYAGTRVGTTTLVGAGTAFDSVFSMSFANGKVWVVDGPAGLWRGYLIPELLDSILQPSYTESMSFTDALGSTTVRLTFDGTNYWSCSGNDTSGDRLARYAADGTPLDLYAPGIDFRSVFTASGASTPVYARGFADAQILVQVSPGVFNPHLPLTGGVLDPQSGFVFNGTNNEFLCMSAGGVVDRYSAGTGNHLGAINLSGYGSLNNENFYPQNVCVGAAGSYILTYTEGSVLSAWDYGGNRVGTTTLIGAGTSFASLFSMSFANNLVWVIDDSSGLWRGYSIPELLDPCAMARIDFGVTPDDFGLFGVTADPLDAQFVLSQSIVFGDAVGLPGGAPPTQFQSDGACTGDVRSSGVPVFATDWWAQFRLGAGPGIPGAPAGVPFFEAEACYIDSPPGTVLMEAFDVDLNLIASASTTGGGAEVLSVVAPPGELINFVRVVSSTNGGGLSIDCLFYPDPVALAQPPCDPGPVLTHSSSDFIDPGVGFLACGFDDSWWRTFDLASFGVTGAIEIDVVEIGVYYSDPGDLMVRIYADNNDNPAPVSDLVLLGEEPFGIPLLNSAKLCLGLTPPIVVPDGVTNLVLEVANIGGGGFGIGYNMLPETDDTYLSTPACGIPEPMTMAAIGFPGVAGVMYAYYDEIGQDFIRGDANGDGSFSGIVDGIYLLSYAFVPGSSPPPCLESADANDNGSFSGLTDGIYLLNCAFVPGSPCMAPPYPTCGPDPDPGQSLGCDAHPGCP